MTIQHIAKANLCFSLFGQKEKAVLRTGAEGKNKKRGNQGDGVQECDDATQI